MLIFWAVLGGFLLDALFGDPAWLPHPVVLMGRCISALEKHLRTALPKTPRGELAGGAAVAAVLPLGTLAVTGLACWAAARLHPVLGLAWLCRSRRQIRHAPRALLPVSAAAATQSSAARRLGSQLAASSNLAAQRPK